MQATAAATLPCAPPQRFGGGSRYRGTPLRTAGKPSAKKTSAAHHKSTVVVTAAAATGRNSS